MGKLIQASIHIVAISLIAYLVIRYFEWFLECFPLNGPDDDADSQGSMPKHQESVEYHWRLKK